MKNVRRVIGIFFVVQLVRVCVAQETTSTPVDSLYHLAVQHHQAGELEQALTLYTQMIASESTHVEAYWNRSLIYSRQENYILAIPDLWKVTELAPEFADAHGNLGWFLILQGQFEDARQIIERTLELAPETMAWTVNLGHIYLLTGEQDSARVYYEKTLPLLKTEGEFKTSPVADFELFIEKGWQPEACARELAWLKDEFAGNYRHYLQADSLFTQAQALYEQNNYLQAATLFVRAVAAEEAAEISREQDLAAALGWAGHCFSRAGKYAEAEPLYKQASMISKKRLGKTILTMPYP